MKWFCNIFGLYLIILSCIPCSDGKHEHAQNQAVATAYLTAANDGSEHEHCADACSPFCGCHCCSVTFTIRTLPAYRLQTIVPAEKKAVFPNLSFQVSNVALAIDHPPQLV
ncbi:MAG: DUF6660 family protein [Saprospiraceae bacterium]